MYICESWKKISRNLFLGTSKVWYSQIYHRLHKSRTKQWRKQEVHLESQLKKLENNLESSDNLRKYESLKSGLELIYDHIAAGVRIRSKCLWYEEGW